MDAATLIAGLPVAIALAAGGIALMSVGQAAFGVGLLGLGVLALMFVAGQGLPKPDVVPRPGEEDQY